DLVAALNCPLVEITGGEPLLQKNVLPLMSMLADAGRTILLETSGAHDISTVDPRVHRIMDLKTPGSGEVERNLWSNIDNLTSRDEVKFVIGSREDYDWSCDKVRLFNLSKRCHAVLFSPIFGRIDPREIVEWTLADRVYDHAEIGAAMKPLLQMLDHSYLNEVEGLENPTIENMAAWFWKKLQPQCRGLCEIVVHETPTARCVYRGK